VSILHNGIVGVTDKTVFYKNDKEINRKLYQTDNTKICSRRAQKRFCCEKSRYCFLKPVLTFFIYSTFLFQNTSTTVSFFFSKTLHACGEFAENIEHIAQRFIHGFKGVSFYIIDVFI